MRRRQIGFSIRETLLRQLDERAKVEDRSRSAMIEILIEQGLGRENRKIAEAGDPWRVLERDRSVDSLLADS